MRKRGKKLVAMALATSMALGTVSMQAFADEPVVVTDTIENPDGTITDQTITTTTTTDSETGNVTVKVEITENTSGTNTEGAVVDGTMSSVEETTTDSEGIVLENNYEEDGSKVIVTEEEVTEEELEKAELPDVKVDLGSEGKGESKVTVEVSKDSNDIFEDGVDIGDETVITVLLFIQRSVQVIITKIMTV